MLWIWWDKARLPGAKHGMRNRPKTLSPRAQASATPTTAIAASSA